jgi:hypothetical protein
VSVKVNQLQGEITAQSVNPFTTADGSLDLKKVKDYVEKENAKAQDGDIQTHYVNPEKKINCFLWICQRLRTGSLPVENNVKRGAYYQAPSAVGRTSQFGFNTCITNYQVNSDFVGCAPMAFIGLVEWYADRGYYFRTVKNPVPGVSSDKTVAYNMTAPVGFRGRPRIADYMRSCYTGPSGVLTVGANFRDGGAAFLRDEGSTLRMSSNISHYAGNVWSAPAKADLLIRNIGSGNRPVIATYFTGFLRGHYSPVVDYAVYGDGSKGLNIRTVGDLTGEYNGIPNYTWYSLSGTWGTERGVFALE